MKDNPIAAAFAAGIRFCVGTLLSAAKAQPKPEQRASRVAQVAPKPQPKEEKPVKGSPRFVQFDPGPDIFIGGWEEFDSSSFSEVLGEPA